MTEKTDVVVIGGGATGTGILRDLALRDIDCVLVERNDLAEGTSGRYHGLLHSGGRYVVKDLHSAQECIEENKILKKIAPDCVEETGGVFVATKHDDLSYPAKWLEGCQKAGIETEELSVSELLKEEPFLHKDIIKAYSVPDAAIDGFTLAAANVLSAQEKGAQVKTYTEVVGFKLEQRQIKGVYIKDQDGKEGLLECNYVINAAGAWAGQVAQLAGESIDLAPDKGVLIIFNHRITQKVVNHLRPPGNGDIFVPHGNVTILGTTSSKTNDPDDNEIKKEEVLQLLTEGKHLIPGLAEFRIIRAFAGARPLYVPSGKAAGRQATREFTLIDHAELTGLEGMVSVVGGKLTTYRLMAQATVDFVAKKLGNDKPCLTDKEVMKAPIKARKASLNDYICECELVSKEMLDKAIKGKENFTLSDIRRLTRLGMGPCQGTFCNYRAVGYLQKKAQLTKTQANRLLKEHIQERWKGTRPVFWGDQAREVELSRGIYIGLLNLDRVDSDSYEL